MSELIDNRAHRLSFLKEIIQHLHAGAAPELVKEQLRKIVGETDATEMMAMEQHGDLLAIIVDGFTETFDSGDIEFGMERVKQILYASGTKDLRYISTEIRARALAHGEQRDDQTILLIRRLR